MSIKYPETFEEVGRKDQILAANSKIQPLTKEDFEKGESPLKTYKPWSCLNLNFAVSGDKAYGGSGAIEVKRIPDVKLRTEIAMRAIMEAEIVKANQNEESGDGKTQELLATKVFYLPKDMNGSRGKTAMEIVKTYGAAKAKEAVQNLKASAANNAKYAANNLKQADALELAAVIAAAESTFLDDGSTVLDLFKGDFNQAVARCKTLYEQRHTSASVAVELFNAINKDRALLDYIKSGHSDNQTSGTYYIYGPMTKTPNVKKVDKDGLTKAYSLCITCSPTHLPYPFHIELTTMRGVPLGADRVGVKSDTIVDRKTFTIDLTTWEWVNIIERADWEAKLVALDAHKEQYTTAAQASAENIYGHTNSQVPAQQSMPQQNPQMYQQYQQPYSNQYQAPAAYGQPPHAYPGMRS